MDNFLHLQLFYILVTIFQYSFAQEILSTVIAKHEDCKKDIPILQNMCELHDTEIDDNWTLLDCLDKIPPEKKISDSCENLVWNFKLAVTRADHFLDEAKKVCKDENFCEHEKSSEPGHMLACYVGRRHETNNIECSHFLTQVY